MKLPPLSRALAHRALRFAALFFILALAAQTIFGAGLTPDLLFFCLAALVWFMVTLLLELGLKTYRWSEGYSRLLLVAIDTYFLVICLGLTTGASCFASRTLAAYCFLVVFVLDPLAALVAACSGSVAYASIETLMPEQPEPVALWIAVLSGVCVVVIGAAWKLGLPLLWKVIRILVESGEQAAPLAPALAEEVRQPPLPAATAGTAAATPQSPATPAAPASTPGPALTSVGDGGQKEVESLRARVAALTTEKDNLAKELESATNELMKIFSGGAPPPAGGAAPGAAPAPAGGGEPELLQRKLTALQAERDNLAKELEQANDEMMKMFGAGSAPAPAAAPGGDGAETEALKKELDAVRQERDKLKQELDQAAEDMMKMFGAGSAPAPAAAPGGGGAETEALKK